jgi:hypothetical protein
MAIQVRVQPPSNVSYSDGNQYDAMGGKAGEVMVSELHGKYTSQNYRGNVFIGASASAGIALIVPATTGGHPTLWNPSGSGYIASIIRLQLSYVSGANAPTALEWAVTTNAGANYGTVAPIATFTNVAPTCANIGAGRVSKMFWAPATNTFSTAPAYLMPTGIALDTMVAASTNSPWANIIDYDGTLMLSPGTALSLCAQATTTTALFQVGLVWEEIPI